MKTLMFCIIICLMCAHVCLGGEKFTVEQVEKIICRDCNTTSDIVFFFDEEYEDYPIVRALLKADCTNYFYKPYLFDCEDIALSVKMTVIKHISELNEEGGAVMFGYAILEHNDKSDPNTKGHVVNLFVEDKKTYLYDYQTCDTKNIMINPKKYLKDGDMSFMLIFM